MVVRAPDGDEAATVAFAIRAPDAVSVIVPLIVNAQEKDSDRGIAYTQSLLHLAVTALGVATVIAVAAAPLLAWAYGAGHDQRQLTSVFATLLLPEIVLSSTVSVP